MSWSRYEDAKAVWHLFSHIEMKYNVLILNASDRINRNDLRFSPEELSTKPPPHTHASAHTQTPRSRRNCLGWCGESWRAHSSNSLIQKCYLCSVKSAASSGPKLHCLCQRCVLALNENVITCPVLLLFFQTTNTIWAEDEYFLGRCCHCWW